MKPVVIASAVLLVLSTLLAIVGVATTHWLSFGENVGHMGLFKSCVLLGICVDYSDAPAWIGATRAFCVIGILLLCGMCALFPFYIFKVWSACPISAERMGVISVILSALASVCLFIGVIVFGAEYADSEQGGLFGSEVNLSWSFALTVVSACTSAGLAVTMFLVRRQGGAE